MRVFRLKLRKATQRIASVAAILTVCMALSFNATAQETISFTWDAGTTGKWFFLTATSGKAFTIDWDDSVVEPRTGIGTAEIISHTYATAGTYNVSITSDDDVHGWFRQFHCNNNQLTALDVSTATGLWTLYCNDNPLGTLNVSSNKELLELRCTNTGLTTLYLNENTELKDLICNDNLLDALNVDNNTK
jgi:hypothetical protein